MTSRSRLVEWFFWFVVLVSSLPCCHGFQRSRILRTGSKHKHEARHDEEHVPRTLVLRSAAAVGGLVEDFDSLRVTHKTIKALRSDIPLLLYKQFTEETASESFTRETETLVTGKADDYVLASSREEMISIQNALLLAVQGPIRATNLLSRQNVTAPLINCRFEARNENSSEILVEWDVQETISNTSFSGTSELKLQDGKVSVHRLRKVRFNGQTQDAEAVGNALSRIRQTVRSLQQAESIQSTIVPFGSMLSQYRNDLIRQLEIVPPVPDAQAPLSFDAPTNNDTSPTTMARPLPGTLPWECYARSHEAITKFVDDIIPKLATAPVDAPFDMLSFFSSDAALVGLDGTVMISENGPRLAKFYQSLAAWRRRSLTTWTLVEATAVEWRERPQVRISFVNDLPGSETVLAGVDRYTLDIEPESGKIQVLSVHQESLSIGGNSKQQDLVLFMRGVVDFVENDRSANADEQWITDLWRRLRNSNPRNSLGKPGEARLKGTPEKALRKTPMRSDKAAATVYRIMAVLHNDGKDLVDPSIVSNHPPVVDFMIENVQLRGLLNEVLVRGKSSYQQNLGFSIGSLKSSLRAERIICEREPLTKVELTETGNIRYSLTLFLKVATFTGIPNLLNIPSTGLPLKVDLISEYILDEDSARIVQHRLVESRFNDQLTPGDVLSRFVLMRTQDGLSLDESAIGRALADVVGRFANNRSR